VIASAGGNVAIVTGAARNIGRQIALALARDGAAVVVNARGDHAGAEETAHLIGQGGGQALVHLANVADETAVAGLVADTASRFGPPTILVNNAALRRQRPFTELALEEWREVMAVNLEAAFLCARACIPHMLAAGRGRIVNIGGKSAHGGASQRAHVVASKAGLVGLTKALATEFGKSGITANCLVPGDVGTLRGASAGPAAQHAGGGSNLIGRDGRPEEIAAMVAMLCRPEAAYTTGQTIHVNGGGYLP